MLDFSDQPYRYFPPKRNPLIVWLLRWYNRSRHLPRVLNIERIEVDGREALSGIARGDRVMVTPNHPTHADAAIFLEAAARARVRPQMMAAYDVFLRSRVDRFVMQRLGAFSVDREGGDQRAMKQAGDTLRRGKYALTIFPEGNVYLQNDYVSPFHDGAALLALRGLKEITQQGGRMVVVPVSIKATHTTDVRPKLREMMASLGKAIGVDLEPTLTPVDALRLLGTAALRRNLRQRGVAFDESDNLPELIQHAGDRVLARLEAKLELTPKPDDTLIDRVRNARRVIHEARIDAARTADHAAATTWADEAMLAFRIASYSGQYLAENPTIDRIAETVEKLTEDTHSRMIAPIGPRLAMVRFNAPITANDYMPEGVKFRAAVRKLTGDIEQSVQKGIDQLNASNNTPGAMFWETC